MERQWNKKKTELIVLVAAVGLLVFGIAPVVPAAPEVTILYEAPVLTNPFGHVGIIKDGWVYDVNKVWEVGPEGEIITKIGIRKRPLAEVQSDERPETIVPILQMTAEKEQLLGKILEGEEGSSYSWTPWNSNCADWVREKLGEVGIYIPDGNPDLPETVLQWVMYGPGTGPGLETPIMNYQFRARAINQLTTFGDW